MTVEHIKRRIEMIRSLHGDFEAQHAEEDLLVRDVLRAIAIDDLGPVDDARDIAEAVLKVCDIPFARCCA